MWDECRRVWKIEVAGAWWSGVRKQTSVASNTLGKFSRKTLSYTASIYKYCELHNVKAIRKREGGQIFPGLPSWEDW